MHPCTHSHVLTHTHTHAGSIFSNGDCSQKTDINPQRFKKRMRGVKAGDKAADERFAAWEDISVLSPPRSWRAASRGGTAALHMLSTRSVPAPRGIFAGLPTPRKGRRLQAPLLLLLHRGRRAAGEPGSSAAAPRGLRGCGTGLGNCQLPYIFQYTNFSCHLASDKQRELNRAIH